jgi:hypothetical protein
MPFKERYVPDHFLLFANEHFSLFQTKCVYGRVISHFGQEVAPTLRSGQWVLPGRQ